MNFLKFFNKIFEFVSLRAERSEAKSLDFARDGELVEPQSQYRLLRRSAPRNDKKGLLLVEVMVTIVILAGGLTLIVQSFMSALRAGVYATDYSLATLLAEDKMTQLLQAGRVKDGLYQEEKFSEPNEKFQYKLTTKNIPAGNQKGLLDEVELVVSWEAGAKERNLRVVTYMLDQGS